MKTPYALLILAFLAVSSPAQQVEIIGIDQFGTITWSNTPTPLYCGVEGKWDMRHTWLPLLDWNVLVTTPVTNTTTDVMALWEQLSAVLQNLTGGQEANALFFRVVASPSPLGPRYATNLIHVANASTSVLVNVEIGTIDSGAHTPITNLASLAQGTTSPAVPVVQDIPPPSVGTVTNLIPMVIVPPVQEGWYVSYEQNASNRLVESMVIPFGSPEKNVGVTVSNNSVTVRFEEFGFGWTTQY